MLCTATQIFQVQAKISTAWSVFPDCIPVSCDYSFTQFNIRMAALLPTTFLIYLHNQLSSIKYIITTDKKNVTHQIDSKNEWLLFSACFQQVLRQNLGWFLS